HWQVALDIGCDFVHLGQEDLAVADMAALRRAGMRIGISTHDHAELDRALAEAPDYVALGPIYPTQLKQMPWAPQGLARIAEWKRLVGARPLVAIGGLTVARAELCLAAGADCVAVVGDIVRHPDPSRQVGAWLAATRALR
ncbi:thiamine phosphate synthase, partial [Devosia elaeis]